jgi:hypothetical protein
MTTRLDAMCPVEKGEGDAKKTYWTKCGSAWVKDDGKISIQLDVLPINGKLICMPPKPKNEDGGF